MARQRAMQQEEMTVKERMNRDDFLSLMKEFIAGMENNERTTLTIKGKECMFPADEMDKAKVEVEYERENDKLELEITVEWKNLPSTRM